MLNTWNNKFMMVRIFSHFFLLCLECVPCITCAWFYARFTAQRSIIGNRFVQFFYRHMCNTWFFPNYLRLKNLMIFTKVEWNHMLLGNAYCNYFLFILDNYCMSYVLSIFHSFWYLIFYISCFLYYILNIIVKNK